MCIVTEGKNSRFWLYSESLKANRPSEGGGDGGSGILPTRYPSDPIWGDSEPDTTAGYGQSMTPPENPGFRGGVLGIDNFGSNGPNRKIFCSE